MVPPFNFFRQTDFFSKFFQRLQRVPLHFFDNVQQMEFQKAQRVSLFTMRLFKLLIFRLKLGFLNVYPIRYIFSILSEILTNYYAF